MNERAIIIAINAAYPIREGSTPLEITRNQQRAGNIVGKLLHHAHKRGKRKKSKWV